MAKTEITAEPGTSQIMITREFDAPRDLVFRCYTDPDLVPRWMGPRELTTKINEWEVRDGGRWNYTATDPNGTEFGFRGVFHGDPSPDLTIQTFEFLGLPGHVTLEALTMTESGGRTLVRTVSSFQSVEDRDGMVASGMEHGVRDSDARMEELLAELRG
ncbi:SRPBCC family protein [Cryptosporangium phraense]|uniref:Polyketide cyclase n=1 Tax=Cryptosporangium phraense TaxID=2593070 RepID=A0A545ADY7_9ACTN|nr:SRPBCC family protein [Cryptosporangium phraense]TQS39541.1 polyketide cyclase [Cryptosporangium phraense]